MTKRVVYKSLSDIAKEWDLLASARNNQIKNNIDISYNKLLLPSILKHTVSCDLSSVLDLGCGNGYLSLALEGSFNKYYGIDISYEMIQTAKENNKLVKNVFYQTSEVFDFLNQNNITFSCVIANMTLMNLLNIDKTMKVVSDRIDNNGEIIVTITHPCFWPIYKKYINEPWFKYDEEIIIESPFEISNEKTSYITTHIHRPIQKYIDLFIANKFSIINFEELIPESEIQKLYPVETSYPKFILMHAKK